MNILVTTTFEDQLKEILEDMLTHDPDSVKSFKMYLDTILLNMPTKAKKYKVSKLFDDEDVQEIEHEGFVIPFYHNKQKNTFVILGIIER
ncbi:MAG: type II toxin-antitoxin system RelE/ParE family toxin [Sulfurimonas sp.]